jgi:hypothetical protein
MPILGAIAQFSVYNYIGGGNIPQLGDGLCPEGLVM